MRLPRFVLLAVCAALLAVAYYLVLGTSWGNLYHAGSYRGAVLAHAVLVLAVFACAEVIRSEKQVQLRALAGAFGAPLLAVIAWLFWAGLRHYAAG